MRVASFLIVVLLGACQGFAQEAAPVTVLYDTGTGSTSAVSGDAVTAKKGWGAIAEDTLVHAFAGDAVFMNDRVAVVLRKGAAGVEVYSKSAGACKERASLVLLGVDGAEGKLSGVKIIENTQAAVMVEVGVSNSAVFSFRLTAGESLLDIRGGKGAGRVRVVDHAEYVVVPDFFADDLVVDPAVTAGARVGLPAENSVLGLADHGGAIVACVWKSSRQNVDLLLSGEGTARAISGYEIDLPAENRLWIAVMEGAGIWHARQVSSAAAKSDLALEWRPPMAARWRTDFAGGDGVSVSTYFADPDAGAEPENAKSNGACRFDGGRPLVRMVDAVAAGSPRLMVVYPVERTRATPLTAFCLVDVMRNALGVGPCQYVLDAEGLGNSESPTPDVVTHWVEKQFEKKAAKRDVDTIKELLEKMSLQVKRTDERALDYVALAGRVKQLCAANGAGANRLAGIAGTMTAPAAGAYAVVEKLANEVVGQAESADALAKCQGALAAIRTAGAGQDYALAKLRMAARRLKQEARTLALVDPKVKDLAVLVEQQAEMMLVKK